MEFTLDLLNKLKTAGKSICITPQDVNFQNALQKLETSSIKDLSSRSVYYWKKGERPIPLKYLIEICDKHQIKKMNIEKLSVNSGNSIRLPNKKEPQLYYLLGIILGDGCLTVNKKSINQNSYTLQITIREKDEAINIKEVIKKLFDLNSSIYKGRGCYNVCSFSKALVILLNKKYSIPIGKKYEKIKVPESIKKDQTTIPYFIKGLFDSDGNIYTHRNKKCVQFRQKSQSFIKEVQKLLQEIGIPLPGPYYDKANNSWLLWSSKKDVVDTFINKIKLPPY